MSASGPPEWGADDTGAVPVGPEPEPTGAAGSGQGPGGWGGKPRVEPFAIAAMVWAVVSIVLPILGTIVALVLSARAADSIRQSRGTRSGMQLVTAARITAGAVIALWAIGLVAFVALGGNDDGGNKVAVPTQPPSTSTSLGTSTTTTTRPTSTTVSTTRPAPTTSTALAPTVVTVAPPPPSTPPTSPNTTAGPTTAAPTTAAPTTAAPTAPTSGPTTAPTQPTTAPTQPTTAPNPGEPEERRITNRLLRPTRLGPSNRGVPNSARVVVRYTPGASVTVTWAIDNGEPPLPTGTPTCAAGPPTTSTTTTSSTSTTSATTTTTSTSTTTTTTAPGLSTVEVARQEAVKILKVLKTDIDDRRLDVTGIQLIGRYPIEGAGTADVDVVQVFYYASTIAGGVPGPAKVFVAPPAGEVQCLNPAFT